ncbi:maltose alpha-D-glucosyltransferase [soil metagenome]
MQNEKIWFKDAVIYELHVRAFSDSSGDGIGDFRGLTEKLPYFEELGITALWLLPFYPSPLRDDGYDIADYYSVNPSYGTLEDFQTFLAEAHKRKLRVITELVINHTSDQHEWFRKARLAPPGSPERDFYVWSDTPRRFEEARIIFKDFETSNWSWDPVAQAYYWHRFYSHQPDLNFDNPAVQDAVAKVCDFWLEMGVDGVRLDAIPYLFEREGTSCENLPETHEYLRTLRHHVDTKFPGRMLLAEANQWPEDATAYFGQGDECHMAFHFPLMPRLFMGIQMEDRFPIIDILEQTPAIPETCQWAIFLRNHDELTLEMVTDEERDYMYRLYAEDPRARINLGIRRRLAPLLNNNRRKIELINSLLLSLPGTPILYYGDEIGMGDNFYLGDRNGVRTPMQWSADRNAGFSRANPQQLFLPVIIDPEFHYEAVNVDVQLQNLSSLFWWMRRILDIRKRHPAFSHGSLEFLRPSNAKVLAYLRKYEDETILVVANLSRFSQAVEIDLAGYKGTRAEELFGGGAFAEITEHPTSFTVGPHGFYWLLLKTAQQTPEVVQKGGLDLPAEWSAELMDSLQNDVLPQYLPTCRWFGQKGRAIRSVKILSTIPDPSDEAMLTLIVQPVFADGVQGLHPLPLYIGKDDAGDITSTAGLVARFGNGMVLWDALNVPACRKRIGELIAHRETWGHGAGSLTGSPRDFPEEILGSPTRLLSGEQSNTTVAFGDSYLLKFFRQFEEGAHPDAEILRALGEKEFPHVPKYAGEIRGRINGDEGVFGLLAHFVKNEGDGWTYALDAISRFFEQVLSAEIQEAATPEYKDLAEGTFSRRMQQLGQRTAELHLCLESITDRPEFAPEPFTSLYQRSLYQTMRSSLRRTEAEITRLLSTMAPDVHELALRWIASTPRILEIYSRMLRTKITASKTRIHGDYHLGQVLNTGNDFVILDFEGEPRKTLGERLLKRSPLVDVAGMLRSIDYAVRASLAKQKAEDLERLRPWTRQWRTFSSRAFLDGYRTTAADASFLPKTDDEFQLLLKAYLLDKAVYEVGYELNYRPEFVSIPMAAADRILASEGLNEDSSEPSSPSDS